MVEGVDPFKEGADSQQSEVVEKPQKSASAGKRMPVLKFTGIASRSMLWSLGLILTATMSATLGATLALMTPLSLPLGPKEPAGRSLQDVWQETFNYRLTRPVNILILGIDRVPKARENSPEIFAGRSDTMLLLRVNPKENTVNMLSIPRDTQIEIPGFGTQKINEANVKGGAALAARMVSRNLNGVPVDRYVRVSTGAFRELVDLLGGVEVFVPHPMSYVDETQKLNIDLAEGWQTLDGEQAEQFARFRNENKGDIGRVQRQQSLLKALRNRLSSSTVLPRLPQIIRVMQKYIDTNLSLEEMLALMNFSLQMQPDNLKMVMLPGRFSDPQEYKASYWILDSEGRDRVMRDYFAIASKPKVPGEGEADLPQGDSFAARQLRSPLKIAIQNASDSPEIAMFAVNYLQDHGFDNVYLVQDWPDRLLKTQIIVQKGDLQGAVQLKKVLGFGNIESDSTGELESDLTIRVGQDWVQFYLKSASSPRR